MPLCWGEVPTEDLSTGPPLGANTGCPLLHRGAGGALPGLGRERVVAGQACWAQAGSAPAPGHPLGSLDCLLLRGPQKPPEEGEWRRKSESL